MEAAPILKLWPEKCDASIPAQDSASRMWVTKCVLDNGVPSWKWKRGPGVEGRMARYPSTAATGQSVLPVRPK